MAQITLDTDQLKDLFSEDNPMRLLLEEVLNTMLEAEMYGVTPLSRITRFVAYPAHV